MNSTPASLLERLAHRAPDDAWPRFVELYTPLIYYWARRAGLAPGDAADLVQEVFAVLVEKMPAFRYDPQQSFRAWLRTVTLNKYRELHRRKQLPRAGGDGVLEEVPAPDAGLDDADYRRHVTRRALELMQAEFPEPTWRACWLTAAEGLPAATVAAQLGLSVDSVYAAKSRVLRRLRRELAGLLD